MEIPHQYHHSKRGNEKNATSASSAGNGLNLKLLTLSCLLVYFFFLFSVSYFYNRYVSIDNATDNDNWPSLQDSNIGIMGQNNIIFDVYQMRKNLLSKGKELTPVRKLFI